MYQKELDLYDDLDFEDVRNASKKEALRTLVTSDLDFHNHSSSYLSHSLHSFPAKFPPQIPGVFIRGLSKTGDMVLDPMMGSGTTLIEAHRLKRKPAGCDIDPLAILMTRAKLTSLHPRETLRVGYEILEKARKKRIQNEEELASDFEARFDRPSKKFINYWFAKQTQLELLALIEEIEHIENQKLKDFFLVVFSSTIITKNGGVSLALDLAHTRPHRAKKVTDWEGNYVLDKDLSNYSKKRQKYLVKNLRSAFDLFKNKLEDNVQSLSGEEQFEPILEVADSQKLPFEESSIDLIVTSPPYAAVAIDYMRAHKFSLVWLGYPIKDLSNLRGKYIGADSITGIEYEEMPEFAQEKVLEVEAADEKKAKVLHRYYSEMFRVSKEMFRVLKPNSCAVLVVGNSVMKGIDIEIEKCLSEIGKLAGFEVPVIGVRNLDRNKRMMPVGNNIDHTSNIQKRMHQEYIIGFYKGGKE